MGFRGLDRLPRANNRSRHRRCCGERCSCSQFPMRKADWLYRLHGPGTGGCADNKPNAALIWLPVGEDEIASLSQKARWHAGAAANSSHPGPAKLRSTRSAQGTMGSGSSSISRSTGVVILPMVAPAAHQSRTEKVRVSLEVEQLICTEQSRGCFR